MNRWAAPIAASRAGAAHLRAGRPCQDAVLCRELRDTDGQPVMLMAVADGHGGRRYRRSEVGSRLACETALAVVADALAAAPPGDGEGGWSHWLAHDLPEAVQRRWMEAVQEHWQSDPGEGGFEPLLYGSTLGLVVMTPRWWGHTGLGDWDLVRVEPDGHARLLEQENEPTALGEATCSLCQPQAASLFARRAALHPLAPEERDFALVLCTDGIRKSCATDADFLTLAAWLAGGGAEAAGDLPAALDRISREGSGDDVTVAIGRAAALGEGPAPLPAPPAAAETPAVTPSPAQAAQASLPRRRRPAIGRAVAIGLVLAAAGGAWLALNWPRSEAGPTQAAAAGSAGVRAARGEAARLCANAPLIPGELLRRRGLLKDLQRGGGDPSQLRALAAGDPLAALIATGFDRYPSPDVQTAPAQGETAPVPAPILTRRLESLGACESLIQALRMPWIEGRSGADGAGQHDIR